VSPQGALWKDDGQRYWNEQSARLRSVIRLLKRTPVPLIVVFFDSGHDEDPIETVQVQLRLKTLPREKIRSTNVVIINEYDPETVQREQLVSVLGWAADLCPPQPALDLKRPRTLLEELALRQLGPLCAAYEAVPSLALAATAPVTVPGAEAFAAVWNASLHQCAALLCDDSLADLSWPIPELTMATALDVEWNSEASLALLNALLDVCRVPPQWWNQVVVDFEGRLLAQSDWDVLEHRLTLGAAEYHEQFVQCALQFSDVREGPGVDIDDGPFLCQRIRFLLQAACRDASPVCLVPWHSLFMAFALHAFNCIARISPNSTLCWFAGDSHSQPSVGQWRTISLPRRALPTPAAHVAAVVSSSAASDISPRRVAAVSSSPAAGPARRAAAAAEPPTGAKRLRYEEEEEEVREPEPPSDYELLIERLHDEQRAVGELGLWLVSSLLPAHLAVLAHQLIC
jgi:hypothetical protein